jgi:hypothetical protein
MALDISRATQLALTRVSKFCETAASASARQRQWKSQCSNLDSRSLTWLRRACANNESSDYGVDGVDGSSV